MGFSFANLTRWLLAAGVTLAVAFTADAQHAGRRPGQAILFSSPDDDSVSSNMPSLTAKPPETLDFANAVQSPASTSEAMRGTDVVPPPPPPAISSAQVQRMQRLLDERKNWPLLTPEQILGLPTREKILGIPDRDAAGLPKNDTVVAQYLYRQEQSRARTNNDNYRAADPAPGRDFSGGQELQLNPNIWTPAGGKPEIPALMSQFLNGTTDHRSASAPAPESGWSKSFNLPAPLPKTTPEQQAALDQFQQLLKPHSPPVGAAKAPVFGGPIFSSSSLAPNPAPGPPAAIPMGTTFTPLSSGIAMPMGVAPLPGLLGPTNTALPMVAPEWKPQAPPWQSSAPQLGAIPQRKF
jgi:hypothetical protein